MNVVLGFSLSQSLVLLSGVILPLIVGLVTTRVVSAGWKAVILAALAFAASLVTAASLALSSGQTFDLGAALLTGLGTFIVAVGTHFGFWKPTSVSAMTQATLVKPKATVAAAPAEPGDK